MTSERQWQKGSWLVTETRLIAPTGEHFPLDVDWMGDRKPALEAYLNAQSSSLAAALAALTEASVELRRSDEHEKAKGYRLHAEEAKARRVIRDIIVQIESRLASEPKAQ